MKILALIFASLLLFGCSRQEKDYGRIYFFKPFVTGINIYSTDMKKNVLRHTVVQGARDIDMNLGMDGTLVFSSNRVLPEDRAARMRLKKGASRRQDLNVFLLEPGKVEIAKEHYATHFGKTNNPEASAGISPDGKWLSFVRSVLPENQVKEGDPENEIGSKKSYDEFYVVARHGGEPIKIDTDDIIVKADWAKVKNQIVFSHFSYASNIAKISLYNADTKKLDVLLENPIANAQIDAPQWSPDGSKISFVSHSLDASGYRSLYVFELETKKLTRVSPADVHLQTPVSWSSDSKRIVYGALENYEQLWDDEIRQKVYKGGGNIFITDLSGKYKKLTEGEGKMNTRPVFSPDDSMIAYMYADELPGRTQSLRVMDSNGKYIDTLYDELAGTGSLIWR